MEVMGNVLDNACKYCLEFVEVSVRQTTDSHLHILVEDDGPGIPQSQRRAVFDRGQRADTLRPGQGVGLSVAREIVEQYDGGDYRQRKPARRRLHGGGVWPPADGR